MIGIIGGPLLLVGVLSASPVCTPSAILFIAGANLLLGVVTATVCVTSRQPPLAALELAAGWIVLSTLVAGVGLGVSCGAVLT